MPSQEEINDQQKVLNTYRKTLLILLRQRAQFTGPYTPPSIEHGILEARANIYRVKKILRGWGVSIQDQPDDDDSIVESKDRKNESASEHDLLANLLLKSSENSHILLFSFWPWLLASIIGWTLGTFVLFLQILNFPFNILTPGLIVGIGQWLQLRKFFRWSSLWILLPTLYGVILGEVIVRISPKELSAGGFIIIWIILWGMFFVMSQHFSCFIFKAKQKNNLVEVTYLVSNDKAEYPMNATEGQLSLWEKAEICAKQKFEVERSGRSNLPFRFSYETRELDEDRKLIIAHVKRYFSDVHWTSVEIWHLKIDNQGEIKEQIAEKISFLSDLHQL